MIICNHSVDARACLKNHPAIRIPLCGIFCPNSFVAARKKGTIFPISGDTVPFTKMNLFFNYFTASNAASRAAIRSSTFSIPMERRIVFGLIPWSRSSSSVHWLCVVVAGWITRDFTSATFASSEKIARLSINF